MGPETGGLCGRVRRETESTPHASTSLTALRVVPEREPMERERGNNIPDIQDDHNNSNYDICSKTTLSNDQHNENEGADSQKPSLLKTLPLSRSRSSTADSLAQEDTNLKIDSSPSRLPQLTQVPSISHSLASLSVDSQAPLSSLASSPKSTSHRSYRPSDDGSVDEASSQALASDSEVESDHPSELQDSAPQLIMPSIKMPSRRPFTDKGSAIGRLKVLLAGDCRKIPTLVLLNRANPSDICRHWQNIVDQIDCTDMRGHRTYRSIHGSCAKQGSIFTKQSKTSHLGSQCSDTIHYRSPCEHETLPVMVV